MAAMNCTSEQIQAVDAALRHHSGERHALVQILREVQAHTHWLPRPVLHRIAQGVGLTPAIVEGVAGFYRFFHLQPVGRVHLLASDNVTDRMQGSRELAAELGAWLGIVPGQMAADGSVSLGFTSCTGLCDQGPALLVNQHQVVTRLDAARVSMVAEQIRAGVPPSHWPIEWQRLEPNIRRAGPLLGADPMTGPALHAALARGAEATLAELAASGLRGRGGAGFDAARKWQLCRAAPLREGSTRVVVCNADEGEPGTFKDRVLLAEQADTVIEGMTVAARVLGARTGFVYLRGEYRFVLEHLQAVLARRRTAGLLGTGILGTPGFDFDIAIHLGAGAYVCGEESALIESLEGKRGQPRIRPPFPVESGYRGQPTVVNNVETYAAAAHIALHGGAWWAAMGVPGSTGSKLHSVSGDVARGQASTNGRSVSRWPRSWPRPAPPTCRRWCRWAGPRVSAWRHMSSAAASPSTMCRQQAPSWSSMRRPRHVRGGPWLRAILCPRELRLLHAVSGGYRARAAALRQARRGLWLDFRRGRTARARVAAARHHPLRPGRQRHQPVA
jgi:[NiFe] hydrogenase diaphorase moiety large subunit